MQIRVSFPKNTEKTTSYSTGGFH